MTHAVKKLSLEKEMYEEARMRGIGFRQLLEELDPTENHTGKLAQLDAYQRQLLAHDIKAQGPAADVLQKFFASTTSAVLFPHYVETQVLAGLLSTSLLPQIVATETMIESHTYDALSLSESEADRQLYEIAEGAELPTTEIKSTEHTVRLRKFGRLFKATYEALRLQKLNVVSVFLQRIGAQIAIDETDWALKTLIDGDGNSNPLVDTNSEVSGTLDYDEMVRLWLAFPASYQCQKIIVGDTLLRTILNMTEFKDPQAGFQFQRTGELVSPVGASLLRWASTAVLATDWVLGIDARYALQQVTEMGVTTETDRLIDRQLETTAISKWTGFVKLDVNASQAIDVTHA